MQDGPAPGTTCSLVPTGLLCITEVKQLVNMPCSKLPKSSSFNFIPNTPVHQPLLWFFSHVVCVLTETKRIPKRSG